MNGSDSIFSFNPSLYSWDAHGLVIKNYLLYTADSVYEYFIEDVEYLDIHVFDYTFGFVLSLLSLGTRDVIILYKELESFSSFSMF